MNPFAKPTFVISDDRSVLIAGAYKEFHEVIPRVTAPGDRSPSNTTE